MAEDDVTHVPLLQGRVPVVEMASVTVNQGVAAFGRPPGGRVQQVHGALIGGQPATGAVLDRDGQRRRSPS
jgi:hypothetical protein